MDTSAPKAPDAVALKEMSIEQMEVRARRFLKWWGGTLEWLKFEWACMPQLALFDAEAVGPKGRRFRLWVGVGQLPALLILREYSPDFASGLDVYFAHLEDWIGMIDAGLVPDPDDFIPIKTTSGTRRELPPLPLYADHIRGQLARAKGPIVEALAQQGLWPPPVPAERRG